MENYLNLVFKSHGHKRQHLQEIGGSVVKSSFPAKAGQVVLRIKFSGGRQFSALKSAFSPSAKTLPAIIRHCKH